MLQQNMSNGNFNTPDQFGTISYFRHEKTSFVKISNVNIYRKM